MSLQIVVEGDTDIPVAYQLAKDAGLTVVGHFDKAGKSQLDLQFKRFNRAAAHSPWFVLRDLDADAACAPALLRAQRVKPAQFMSYRIAVRAIEAWLLADVRAVSRFLHIKESWCPQQPDQELNPTTTLVNLARRSTRSSIVRAMVPVPGFSTPVGKLYEATIIEFGTGHWSLDRACERSPSLVAARQRLKVVSRAWARHVQSGHAD